MKSHIVPEKNTVKFVRQELEKYYEEVFREVASDVAQQVLTNVLVTLEKSYGFGKKRLERFERDVEDMTQIMNTPTPISHRFTSTDNINYLNKKYGIDLKQFKIEVVKGNARRSGNDR